MLKSIANWIKIKFEKTKQYELNLVFTPSTAANISYIARPSIEEKLKKSLDIIGKQVVIYGHSGSGKTTILSHVLNEEKRKKITTRCTSESTISTIILDAFEELNPYYTDTIISTDNASVKANLASEYLGIKHSIEGTLESSRSETQKRLLPPQLTIQRLALFVGASEAVWVIEDFHKVESQSKKDISQMMKLFMDISAEYHNCKIIILGASDSSADVVSYDRELINRISEVEVPLLNEEEIKGVLLKGALALNVNFSDSTISSIVSYSNCLATIAHQLAYNLCYNRGVHSTQKRPINILDEEMAKAIEDFTTEKQHSYEELYLKITKQKTGTYKNVELILKQLSSLNQNEITQHDLYTAILKEYPEYPQGNLSTYLKKLVSVEAEEVLRNKSGRYSFSDPFFKAYVKMLY